MATTQEVFELDAAYELMRLEAERQHEAVFADAKMAGRVVTSALCVCGFRTSSGGTPLCSALAILRRHRAPGVPGRCSECNARTTSVLTDACAGCSERYARRLALAEQSTREHDVLIVRLKTRLEALRKALRTLYNECRNTPGSITGFVDPGHIASVARRSLEADGRAARTPTKPEDP